MEVSYNSKSLEHLARYREGNSPNVTKLAGRIITLGSCLFCLALGNTTRPGSPSWRRTSLSPGDGGDDDDDDVDDDGDDIDGDDDDDDDVVDDDDDDHQS